MASCWIQPTAALLVGTLSKTESDTYARSVGTGQDAVAAVLSAAVDYVRGCCLARRSQGPSGTVPPSLLRATLAIAAYDLLKRMPVEILQDRRIAKDDAEALLRDVREGRFLPEDGGDPPDEGASVLPSSADPVPARILDE